MKLFPMNDSHLKASFVSKRDSFDSQEDFFMHRFLWRLMGRWGAAFQAILENQYHDGVVVEALRCCRGIRYTEAVKLFQCFFC